MSKHNNVNPGQYKVGGRERANTVAEDRMKAVRNENLRNSGETKRSPKKRRTRG
jgi:hypothetical protein